MMYLRHGGVDRLRRLVASDPAARRFAEAVLARAEALRREPLVAPAYEPGRAVMLPASRTLAERVHVLGVAWMIEGRPACRRRGIDELLAAAGFDDWNPAHFLDTAEMMAGVALGRDWFQAGMTGAERRQVDAAIIRLGLEPGLAALEAPAFWVGARHNWTIVCCGGLIVAALALRAAAPALCQAVLERAAAALAGGLAGYAPDGGWAEGPGYWEYATRYAAFAVAALEEAGLDTRGLGRAAGLAQAWRFGRAVTGPSGLAFDYGDNLPEPDRCPALGWLALKSGDPAAAAWQHAAPGEPHPFDLVWFAPAGGAAPPQPAATLFETAGIAVLQAGRGGEALHLAIRGGRNDANHAHLDLGSFVLEARGRRFVWDLGRDDYALPGYFDPARRFGYLRTGTAAHNIVLAGAANQSLAATAPCLGLSSGEAFAAAVLEIDDPASPLHHRRGFALVEGRHAVVVDELAPRRPEAGPVAADWRIHTRAAVTCDGRDAELSLGGETLGLRWAGPAGAALRAAAVPSPPGEASNAGFTRLAASFAVPAQGLRIRAVFSVDPAAGEAAAARLPGLAAWPIGG